MTPAEARAALELHDRIVAKISTPETWTQGSFARNSRDRKVRPDGNGAVCWCYAGALSAVHGTGPTSCLLYQAFAAVLGCGQLKANDLAEDHAAFMADCAKVRAWLVARNET